MDTLVLAKSASWEFCDAIELGAMGVFMFCGRIGYVCASQTSGLSYMIVRTYDAM